MGISLVEMLSWCCQQIVPPLVTTEDDADPSSDLGFIKTGTTSINPNARQFYLHPHPQSLHHTTTATFVSTHLKTASFSLMRDESAERAFKLSVTTHMLLRPSRGRTSQTDTGQGRDNNIQLLIHSSLSYHVKFCTHCNIYVSTTVYIYLFFFI